MNSWVAVRPSVSVAVTVTTAWPLAVASTMTLPSATETAITAGSEVVAV